MRYRHLPERGGIYLITNTVTGKVYVGSSKNLLKRLKDHKKALLKGWHLNKALQKDVILYGLLNFTVEALEYVDKPTKANLTPIENQYIRKYNSIVKGYNEGEALVPKGRNQLIREKKYSTEVGRKISKTKLSRRGSLGKEYKVINPDGEVITIQNVALFCEKNSFSKTAFRRMANGGRNYKGYKHYKNI